MQGFFTNLLNEAAGHGRALATTFALLLAAALVSVAGAGMLTAAAYLWLEPLYGARNALLYIGGVMLVVAVLLAVYGTMSRKPATTASAARVKAAAASSTPTPAAVDGLLKMLKDNGRDSERLAILTASEAIKNAKPFQLIATSLVAGYVGGQVLKQIVGKSAQPD